MFCLKYNTLKDSQIVL